MNYLPKPVNTDDICLPDDILVLAEILAENAHDVWAKARISEGWKYGESRDDMFKEHPCLIPYSSLSDSEKQYDRNAAIETLKLITSLGYSIIKTEESDD